MGWEARQHVDEPSCILSTHTTLQNAGRRLTSCQTAESGLCDFLVTFWEAGISARRCLQWARGRSQGWGYSPVMTCRSNTGRHHSPSPKVTIPTTVHMIALRTKAQFCSSESCSLGQSEHLWDAQQSGNIVSFGHWRNFTVITQKRSFGWRSYFIGPWQRGGYQQPVSPRYTDLKINFKMQWK